MSFAISARDVVDVHAHAVLEETLGAAGEYGPEILELPDGRPAYRIGDYRLNGVRYRGGPFMDPALRLAAMDRAGIAKQVLSPNPLTYFHFIPAAEAIAYCRRHNDALARVVAHAPERFIGLAALPMQAPQAAADELERAARDLGLKGAMIGARFPEPLDAAAFDPLWTRFTALDLPLFIHPAPDGIDGPAADPRLKRFELDILFGFTADETLAALTLILGGVLERHPKLDVCVSHGGGALAFIAGRMAHACRKRAWVPDFLKPEGAFEARLKRLWFDTHVHGRGAQAMLLDMADPDRLVFGTNFAGWDQDEHAETAVLALPHAQLAANAARLMRAPFIPA